MEKKLDLTNKDAAIFIMPRSSKAWVGAEALWITVAGWAAAGQRKLGKAWVVTPDRIASPQEVIHYPLVNGKAATPSGKRSGKGLVPLIVKTFLKDLLLWRKNRQWNNQRSTPWTGSNVAFVWQQHDLFAGPGRKIADQLGVPLISYVHAPAVWEAAKWGVKRPLWGALLEYFFERRSLKEADIVACVSEEVAARLRKMGVDPTRIVVSPMSVDPFLFSEHSTSSDVKESLGLRDKFVIGWTGSFRSFHGLDILLRVFQEVHKQRPDSVLLFVGDGQERPALEEQVKQSGLEHAVLFLGKKPFADIPKFVSLFDVAIVSARSATDFHYSPLKLREYLAAGKATLAPRAGEIPVMFKNEEHLLLYTVGDIQDSASKILRLMNDKGLREALSRKGAAFVLTNGTWDYELEKVLKHLGSA